MNPTKLAEPGALEPLEMLVSLTRRMVGVLDPDSILETLLDYVVETFSPDRALVMLAEGAGGELRVWGARNLDDSKRKTAAEEFSRSIVADVLAGKGPVLVHDARLDPQTACRRSIVEGGIRTVVCLPLLAKDQVVGTLYLDNRESGGYFTAESQNFLLALANLAAIAIENARLYASSIRDGLTGLFHHGHFEWELRRELERAGRRGRSVGLLVFDVDRFKSINDTHGHARGSAILKELSDLLGRTLRRTDLLARRPREAPGEAVIGRYGGDEFEIILPEVDRAGLVAVCERLTQAVRRRKFLAGDLDLSITLSIGAAVYPEDARTAEDLFLRADEALYQAKAAGRDRYRLHEAASA